jgi:hypothetical protein
MPWSPSSEQWLLPQHEAGATVPLVCSAYPSTLPEHSKDFASDYAEKIPRQKGDWFDRDQYWKILFKQTKRNTINVKNMH